MKKNFITKVKTLFSKTKTKIVTSVLAAAFFMTNTMPVMAASGKSKTTTGGTDTTFGVDLGGLSAEGVVGGIKAIATGVAMILGAGICIFAAFAAVYAFRQEDQEGRNKAMQSFAVGGALLGFSAVLGLFFK